jgi:hypothetical protein
MIAPAISAAALSPIPVKPFISVSLVVLTLAGAGCPGIASRPVNTMTYAAPPEERGSSPVLKYKRVARLRQDVFCAA